jgi:hypothetical protein
MMDGDEFERLILHIARDSALESNGHRLMTIAG